jgi:tripartite-type tricarboxylate transporter receptor subunit TctC
LCVAACGGDAAHAPDDFYRGKVITFYVGGGPGGGFDIYARTLSPYLTKYIPGNPTVVIENMAGAGSLPLLRTMESRSPQDGTVLGMFVSTAIVSSMLDPENMGVDFDRMQYIGNMSWDFGVCFSIRGKGVQKVEDLYKRQFTFGDTSVGGGSYFYSTALDSIFGENVKHVLGYVTTQDVYLATERGEVEVNCNGYNTLEAIRPDWIENNSINIFVKFTDEGAPQLAHVPSVYSLDIPEDTKRAIRFLLSFVGLTRPIVTTPGTPPERVQVLREAYDKAVVDPGFLADAATRKIKVDPLDGEALEAAIKEIRETPPEIVALARQMSK